MEKGKKICRICGKEYEVCKPVYTNAADLYRWQDVACCVEHGAEYFALVEASRSVVEKPAESKATVADNATTAAKDKEDAAGRKKGKK